MKEKEEVFGEGRYLKVCAGCRKGFRTEARNARYGPPELCRCLERKAKLRLKRRKERRKYHREPDKFRALSRTRSVARKIMIEYYRRHVLTPGCPYPGCKHQGWEKLTHNLQVHHRSGDPFDNPDTDAEVLVKLQWVCRKHHDIHDHARNYGIVPYRPDPDPFAFLLELRNNNPRKFFTVSCHKLLAEWQGGS